MPRPSQIQMENLSKPPSFHHSPSTTLIPTLVHISYTPHIQNDSHITRLEVWTIHLSQVGIMYTQGSFHMLLYMTNHIWRHHIVMSYIFMFGEIWVLARTHTNFGLPIHFGHWRKKYLYAVMLLGPHILSNTLSWFIMHTWISLRCGGQPDVVIMELSNHYLHVSTHHNLLLEHFKWNFSYVSSAILEVCMPRSFATHDALYIVVLWSS